MWWIKLAELSRAKRSWLLLLGGVSFLLGFSFLWSQFKAPPEVEVIKAPYQEEGEREEILVDVAGAVMRPGVYRLKAKARVQDALLAAGGLAPKADREWVAQSLNLARVLRDGEKIYIPKIGERVEGEVAGWQAEERPGPDKVNINTAGVEELTTLPGIGPAFARRIIEYRRAHGGFRSLEEIMAVPGIGEKTFAKIKDKITL